jgi:hypothetical protein
MQDSSVPKGPGLDIQALLAEFDSSRERGADFARRKGIPPWKLYHALSDRRRKQARATSLQRGAGPALVPVRVASPAPITPTSKLELVLPGGQRLLLDARFDEAALRRVLAVLSSC